MMANEIKAHIVRAIWGDRRVRVQEFHYYFEVGQINNQKDT